jgi:hypothetical protein
MLSATAAAWLMFAAGRAGAPASNAAAAPSKFTYPSLRFWRAPQLLFAQRCCLHSGLIHQPSSFREFLMRIPATEPLQRVSRLNSTQLRMSPVTYFVLATCFLSSPAIESFFNFQNLRARGVSGRSVQKSVATVYAIHPNQVLLIPHHAPAPLRVYWSFWALTCQRTPTQCARIHSCASFTSLPHSSQRLRLQW